MFGAIIGASVGVALPDGNLLVTGVLSFGEWIGNSGGLVWD